MTAQAKRNIRHLERLLAEAEARVADAGPVSKANEQHLIDRINAEILRQRT